MMAQNPQMQMQLQEMKQRIEARKAVLIAEMMEEFLKEERQVTSGFGNDPIAQLRARELDLRAMDNQRKKVEGQEKINLDRMKAMMNQSDKQDKLEQNEELAKLRANTSIEKTILSKSIPNVDKMMPSVEIEKIRRRKSMMKKKKMKVKKKKSFPDMSGDGKVTKKDILIARGVIKKPGMKKNGKKR